MHRYNPFFAQRVALVSSLSLDAEKRKYPVMQKKVGVAMQIIGSILTLHHNSVCLKTTRKAIRALQRYKECTI